MPRRIVRTERVPAAGPAAAIDLCAVDTIVSEGDPQGNLIALLQRVQEEFGYVPEPVVDEIARLSGVPASRIHGILTFYAQFSTVPSGRHKICVCHGTACHVAGAGRLTEAFEQQLGVEAGGTTDDMEFSLDAVACMGACSLAPVMRVDAETYGGVTADKVRKVVRELVKELGLEAAYSAGAVAGGDGDA